MGRALEYPPMMTPMDQAEPGSAEYFLSGSYRIQRAVESGDRYTVSKIVEVLSELFSEKNAKKPWDVLPAGKPWRTAAPWIEQVFQGTWKELRPVIEKKAPEIAKRLDAEMHPGKGGHTTGLGHHNVMTRNQGNGRAYTMGRLKREAPELFDRVVAGELSANAAAIKAGFRKKLTPLEAARKAIARLSEEDRATLVAELIKEDTQ